MLISALTLTGTLKQLSLMRLVAWWEEHRGEDCQLKKDELAKRLQICPRTVRYWIKQLVEAGLLIAHERRFEAGGSQANRLAIDWEAVQKIATDRGAKIAKNRGANRGAKTPDRGAKIAPPIRNVLVINNTTKKPNPPPNHNSAPSGSWDRVVVEVGLLGVEQREKAIASIARHGGTPAIVDELLAVFRQRRSQWSEARQPIVLYRRLRLWRRDQNVADGWPPPDCEFVDPRIALARRIGKI